MHTSFQKQAGVSTLLTCIIFLLVMGIAALAASRTTLTEQRMGVNEYRSIQSLQSAQAGLDVLLAQIVANTIPLSNIAMRNDGVNFNASTRAVSGTALLNLGEGNSDLNFRVFAVRDSTDPANLYIYVSSDGFSDCDSTGSNCQSNSRISARIRYSQNAGTGATPAILSVNGNAQLCGAGQVGQQCSSVNAYMNTNPGDPKYTKDAITYGGQINGQDSAKDANGRDVINSNTTMSGSDAQGPTVDKTAAKDVGTLSSDAYFKQFFGDTKANIKNGSTTVQVTPSQLANVAIPDRKAGSKPPVIWVNGDVTPANLPSFWNYVNNKDVIVIIDGNLTINSNNHGATVGFLYVTGNLNADAGGNFDLYGAMGIEGNLSANSSFALRPRQNPNNLLNFFTGAATLNLIDSNWSDF